MRGILLAGGTGNRLLPVTRAVSKQLIPIYDKPMVYYPLSTLMLAGIREILVITTPHEAAHFHRLLGDGSQFGIDLTYAVQKSPDGVAQALVIGEQHIDGGTSALVLGDNILYGPGLGGQLRQFEDVDGAAVFAYPVADPEAYAVIELDPTGRPVALEEKPADPRGNLAVPGLYFYGPDVVERAKALRPSARGELEITDLNLTYLVEDRLAVQVLPRGSAWLDSGSFEALNDAGNYVRTLEVRQGTKVAAPEEVAWRMGYIDDAQLTRLGERLLASGYGDYLLGLLRGPQRAGS